MVHCKEIISQNVRLFCENESEFVYSVIYVYVCTLMVKHYSTQWLHSQKIWKNFARIFKQNFSQKFIWRLVVKNYSKIEIWNENLSKLMNENFVIHLKTLSEFWSENVLKFINHYSFRVFKFHENLWISLCLKEMLPKFNLNWNINDSKLECATICI